MVEEVALVEDIGSQDDDPAVDVDVSDEVTVVSSEPDAILETIESGGEVETAESDHASISESEEICESGADTEDVQQAETNTEEVEVEGSSVGDSEDSEKSPPVTRLVRNRQARRVFTYPQLGGDPIIEAIT